MFVAPRTRIPSLSFPTPERRTECLNKVLVVLLGSELGLSSSSSCSPCIWTRNSVLILRAASLSFSLLEPHRESTSSMKMIDGLCSRAKLNRFFTSLEREKQQMVSVSFSYSISSRNGLGSHFSLSPNHLDTRSEEEMEKKVELLASVATALARYDFPVPGGPKRRIPRQGVRFPTHTDTVLLNTVHTGGLKMVLSYKPVNRWGNLMGRMTASFKASLAPSSPATSSHLMFGFSMTMAPVGILYISYFIYNFLKLPVNLLNNSCFNTNFNLCC